MAGLDPKIIGNTFVKLDRLTGEIEKQQDEIRALTSGLAAIVSVISGDDVKAIIESKAKEVKGEGKESGVTAGLKKSGVTKSVKEINKIGGNILKELQAIRATVCGIADGKGIGGGSTKSLKEGKLDGKLKEMNEMSEKVSGMVKIVERFKDINLKDIVGAVAKTKLISGVIEKFKGVSDKFSDKEMKKMLKLSEALPDIIGNISKASVAMKLIPKDVMERVDSIIIGTKKKMGLVKLSEEIKKNEDNIKDGASMMKTICGTSVFIGLTAMILAPTAVTGPLAAIGVMFLEKMFFGFSGDGGLVKILKELGEHKKDIASGSLMLIAVSASTATALALTALGLKAIMSSGANLETMIIAGTTLLIETMVIKTVSSMGLKTIAMGSLGIVIMGGAFLVNAIAMKKMYEAVDQPDWKKFAMIMATVGAEIGIVALAGIVPGGLMVLAKGSIVIALIGGAFMINAIAMKKMYEAIDKPDWKKFAMIMATVGAEIAVAAVAGLIPGGVAVMGMGAISIALVGGAFMLNAMAMGKMYAAVDKPDWKKFALIMATVGAEVGVAFLAGTIFAPAILGAPVIFAVGEAFEASGIAMGKMYESVKDASWEKLGIIAATVGGELVLATVAGATGLLALPGAGIIKKVSNAFLLAGESMEKLMKVSSSMSPNDWVNIETIIRAQANLSKEIGGKNYRSANKGARRLKSIARSMKSMGKSLTQLFSDLDGNITVDRIMSAQSAMMFEINVAKRAGEDSKDILSGAMVMPILANAFTSIGNSVTSLFSSDMSNISDGQVDLFGKLLDMEISLSEKAGKSYKKIFSGAHAIRLASRSLRHLPNALKGFSGISESDIAASASAISSIVGSFADKDLASSRKIRSMTNFFESLSNPNLVGTIKNLGTLGNAADSINKIDIEKANTLRDILSELNKSDSSREDRLIDICSRLIDTLNINTDAINGSTASVDEEGAETSSQPGIQISNIRELADEIAKRINSMTVDCDSVIDLRINGDGGNEWRISRV